MFHQLTSGVKDLHREESGAVLLLSLAASLILMLLAWVLYDGGLRARKKLQTQAAADSAAFSQAAIKSRSMNMIAYTNVSKRSIWGVHSLYPAYLKSMYDWTRFTIEDNCPDCSDPTTTTCRRCRLALNEASRWRGETCGETSCTEVVGGSAPVDAEMWGFFRHLHGFPYADSYMQVNSEGEGVLDTDRFTIDDTGAEVMDPSDPYSSLTYKYYAQDIRALDNYQRYIYGITPWWAWVEHLVRSVRSGASISGSWPTPIAAWPVSVDGVVDFLINQFRNLYGSAYAGRGTTVYTDSLPTYPADIGTMRDHIWGSVEGGDSAIFDVILDCIGSAIGLGTCAPTESLDPFLIEHLVNGVVFTLKSVGVVRFDYGMNNGNCPSSSLLPGLDAFIPAPLCIHQQALFDDFEGGLKYTENSFENILNDGDLFDGRENNIAAEPWIIRPAKSEGHWRLSMSNIVMTYRTDYGMMDDDRDRRKYGFLSDDYRKNDAEGLAYRSYLYGTHETPATGLDLARQEVTYKASGMWSMARSEIYYDGDEADLWHPSWSARLRPLVLGVESQQAEYTMAQVYHDIMPSFVLAALLGITSVSDITTALADLAFMDKALMSMTDNTMPGVVK